MTLLIAAALVLLDAPLPPPSEAPCQVCTCCEACPCQSSVKTVKRVVRDFLDDDTVLIPPAVPAPVPDPVPVPAATPVPKVETVSTPPAPVKTWVRLVNEPGVEAYGSLGSDGYVYGIEARRYAVPPMIYAPAMRYTYSASACANGSCAQP